MAQHLLCFGVVSGAGSSETLQTFFAFRLRGIESKGLFVLDQRLDCAPERLMNVRERVDSCTRVCTAEQTSSSERSLLQPRLKMG